MRGYWINGALLLVWLVLSWFLGSWLGLKGSDLWYLRDRPDGSRLDRFGICFFLDLSSPQGRRGGRKRGGNGRGGSG